MSKVSDAKTRQNYNTKPIPRTCVNCRSFTSGHVKIKSNWTNEIWLEEKNLRCNLGGFAVKETATCDLYEHKEGTK